MITVEGQERPVVGTATGTVWSPVHDVVLHAWMTQGDGALFAEDVLSEEEDGAHLSLAQFASGHEVRQQPRSRGCMGWS